MAEKSPWIVETTDASFQADVLERSHERLVVVDFWAPWCGPCRMLGPVLEKLAHENAGQFVLVKANADETPTAAAEFGVQSIPAVFAVREGRVVDQFIGAMPEPQIGAWLEALRPGEDEQLAAEAENLMVADPESAEAKFRKALETNVHNLRARKGLAQLLFDRGEHDEARQLLSELSETGSLDLEGEQLLARIELGGPEGPDSTADLESLRTAADAAPHDGSKQLQLARALASAGEYESAMERALQVVQLGQVESTEQARQFLVQMFQLLGPDDPRTTEYRRRLTMLLY